MFGQCLCSRDETCSIQKEAIGLFHSLFHFILTVDQKLIRVDNSGIKTCEKTYYYNNIVNWDERIGSYFNVKL